MSVSAHNRKYKEEHNKVILDSFCLEKNDFLFNSGSNSITKHKLILVNEQRILDFKKIWIVISKLQKWGMDALSVSPPGKYKVMKTNFGSSAGFHGWPMSISSLMGPTLPPGGGRVAPKTLHHILIQGTSQYTEVWYYRYCTLWPGTNKEK